MRKFIGFVFALVCVFAFVGCDTKSVDSIIDDKPSVIGVVQEVYENSVVIYADDFQGYPNGSRWSIPLDVENEDSYLEIRVGDEIVVYFDGNIMETEPLQIGEVYAITLKTPANR